MLSVPTLEERPPDLPKIRPCYLAGNRKKLYIANARKSQGVRCFRMNATVAQKVDALHL
jgi:hypothetical protein